MQPHIEQTQKVEVEVAVVIDVQNTNEIIISDPDDHQTFTDQTSDSTRTSQKHTSSCSWPNLRRIGQMSSFLSLVFIPYLIFLPRLRPLFHCQVLLLALFTFTVGGFIVFCWIPDKLDALANLLGSNKAPGCVWGRTALRLDLIIAILISSIFVYFNTSDLWYFHVWALCGLVGLNIQVHAFVKDGWKVLNYGARDMTVSVLMQVFVYCNVVLLLDGLITTHQWKQHPDLIYWAVSIVGGVVTMAPCWLIVYLSVYLDPMSAAAPHDQLSRNFFSWFHIRSSSIKLSEGEL